MLVLCIPQILLSLSMSVIFENGSSDLQFLCNEQTFLSLSTIIIVLPISTMLFLMHSTDLASTLKSHFCSSNLHFARFWIGQTLFFLFFVQLLTTILMFLFIAQTLLSLSLVIDALPSSILFFYVLHRPGCLSQQ